MGGSAARSTRGLTRSRGTIALAIALGIAAHHASIAHAAPPAHAVSAWADGPPPDSSRSRPSVFERADLVYAFAATVAVAAAAGNDLWLRREALESHSNGEQTLARAAEHLGNPVVVLPALVAGYGLARAARAPHLAAAFTELGASVIAAGGGALSLKEITGRARPADTPGDSDELRPFSGQSSFPSGHAAVAFAAAESIRLSSGAWWAPWLAYPGAALVGWSRVHDDRHWASDVVAGAALGAWSAREVHRFREQGSRRPPRIGLGWCLPDGTPGVVLSLR